MTPARVLPVYRAALGLSWAWAWLLTLLGSLLDAIPAPRQSGKAWDR